MKYISVVPSVRTPFGVDVFDYAVRDDADVQPGDLIMIQFRKKSLPALIVSVQPTSSFKGKTIELHPIQTIVRFLPVIVCLLEDASQHSFASRPSILHSWLRRIPARLGDQIVVSPPLDDNKKDRSDLSSYTLSSPSKIINIIQSEREDPYQGRTLIVTPWQSRRSHRKVSPRTSTSRRCSVCTCLEKLDRLAPCDK